MNIYVLLPAYNEERNLSPILTEIERIRSQWGEKNLGAALAVILVDDGSTDGTAQTAQSFSSRIPIFIEKHPVNRGFGPALRTGLKKASSLLNEEDILITMDADNSHPFTHLLEMIQKIKQGADVVVCSRYVAGAREIGVPLLRRITSYAASFLLRCLVPIPGVRDYSSGYRAYRAPIIKKLHEQTHGEFFAENSFACMAELLLNLKKIGVSSCEVPLILRYDLKKGKSKMKMANTIWRYGALIFKQC